MPATQTPNVQPGESPAEPSNGHVPTDQEQFDAVVDRDSRIVLAILAAVGILAALGMSAAALVQSGSNSAKVTTVTRTVTVGASASAAATTPAVTPSITLSVEGGSKRGPEGKMHDAFSKTDFEVKAGQPTKLVIDNKDSGTHSITSPQAGVAIMVLPGKHTYTLTAKTAGKFEWVCIVPCDEDTNGWAMRHPGYMAGYIIAS